MNRDSSVNAPSHEPRAALPILRVVQIPGRNAPNPYFRLLYGELEKNGIHIVAPRDSAVMRAAFDIVHLNFPNHYVTEYPFPSAVAHFAVTIATMGLLKILGKRFVYTVHDVEPLHSKNRRLARLNAWLISRLVDGFVFLSKSSEVDFFRLFPHARSKLSLRVAHGPYPTEILSEGQRAVIRGNLGVGANDFCVGYIGAIKNYKNPEELLLIPKYLPRGREIKLVIAGRDETERSGYIAGILKRLRCSFRKIETRPSDVELDGIIQALDVAFFPYSQGSNSGAAMLCLSNGTRIIASRLPMFRELEEEVGPPWVYTYAHCDDGSAIEAVLGEAESLQPAHEDKLALGKLLNDCGFDRSANAIAMFYRALISLSKTKKT